MTAATARAALPDVNLTGTQRVALLLMVLDKDTARTLLKGLSSDDLEAVGLAMAEVEDVPASVVEQVVADFVRDMHDAVLVPRSGTDFALHVLPGLIDEGRRPRVVQKLKRRLSSEFRQELARVPPAVVAAALRGEHPQTRAVAILLLGEDMGARVLGGLTPEERQDAARRMAQLTEVPIEVVEDVEAALREALAGGAPGWAVPGVDKTAKTLGRLAQEQQTQVLEAIALRDGELSDTLRRRMVVFDDILSLDNRGMQVVLKQVDRLTVATALRGAKAELRKKVLDNLSSRAAEDLAEEIDLLGPIPRARIESARQEVVETVLRLQSEGTITLALDGAEVI